MCETLVTFSPLFSPKHQNTTPFTTDHLTTTSLTLLGWAWGPLDHMDGPLGSGEESVGILAPVLQLCSIANHNYYAREKASDDLTNPLQTIQ